LIYQKQKDMTTTTATLTEMISTGIYNEKAIAKFHAKQVKYNNGNTEIADAMVRIYKHNFIIRKAK
jgi:hypothetical protein